MDSLDKENNGVSYEGIDMKMKRAFVKLPSQNIGEELKESDEVLTNQNLIFEDSSDLPYGWSRFKERRKNSSRYDTCILTSCGTRIDRQKKLDEFISLKALDLNINFSGSGKETVAEDQGQGGKRKLVQQGISAFIKTDPAAGSGPLRKKLKPNVVDALAKGVSNQETEKAALGTDGEDSSPVPSALDESVKSVSETLESSSNVEVPSDEITPVREDLPTGWTRKQIPRAFRKNETIVVVLTPDGKQFDCQKKLNSYIARNKLNIKVSINGLFEKFESKEPEVKPNTEEKAEVEDTEKKERRKGKKERTAETDGALTNKEVDEGEEEEELTKDELNYISEIKKFLKANKLALSPTPPTKGDGNCWFRAVAEQVEFHQIPDKAKNYRSLRLEDIQQNMIDVVFLGKKRGLSDLASRQRKDGQWVDNTGVMVLATALYLSRNIHLYSYASTTTNEVSLTKIDGGEKASDAPPITIFFYDRHYQTLRPTA